MLWIPLGDGLYRLGGQVVRGSPKKTSDSRAETRRMAWSTRTARPGREDHADWMEQQLYIKLRLTGKFWY